MNCIRCSHRRTSLLIALVALAWSFAANLAISQQDFDLPPINYSKGKVADPVARLIRRISDKKQSLNYDPEFGYLKAILKKLNVSHESQVLVFSKTSFQQRRISPSTPRALYFNDEVYIGYVPRGDVLEFSAVDPRQGAVFYTLSQDETKKPKIVRDRGNCLTCHASSRTHGVPGHFVRSVYPSISGLPHFGAGTFQTTHASPLKERWGGWYVTGTHGNQRHMGNVVAPDRDKPDEMDVEAGANQSDLSKKFNTKPYLTAHSDIVALMVLEHQVEMHNRITSASYEARNALHQSATMNKVLERPVGFVSESATRRIHTAAEKLIEYLLFIDEAKLTAPVRGTSHFADTFTSRGVRDRRGRSLRDFDLSSRLFKYPCSYLIYSEAFDALPKEILQRVYRRLWEILSGEDEDERFAHLSANDRENILQILRETKKNLPEEWGAQPK